MTGFPLYHCDNPLHGYCFHLDDDLSQLSEEEKLEWKQLATDEYYGVYETLAEVDEAIERAKNEASNAYDDYEEAEEEVAALEDYRRLLEKKNTIKPKRELYPIDYRTVPMGFVE